MPHAFSIVELFLRGIFILIDIVGNIYTLSTHQSFIISMDYVPFIVLFNAGMILFICVVDFMITVWRRLRTNYIVGEGITDLHRHEL